MANISRVVSKGAEICRVLEDSVNPSKVARVAIDSFKRQEKPEIVKPIPERGTAIEVRGEKRPAAKLEDLAFKRISEEDRPVARRAIDRPSFIPTLPQKQQDGFLPGGYKKDAEEGEKKQAPDPRRMPDFFPRPADFPPRLTDIPSIDKIATGEARAGKRRAQGDAYYVAQVDRTPYVRTELESRYSLPHSAALPQRPVPREDLKKTEGKKVAERKFLRVPREHALPTQNRPDKPYMRWIEQGIKTAEGRVYRGLVSQMKPGDTLKMHNRHEYLICKIIDVVRYQSFKEMIENVGLKDLLPFANTVEEGVRIYESFPGAIDVRRLGAVAIKIKPIGKITRY